ncbi:MAG: glycosylhydrolase-like jelly roll fold domain-containing protein, partial [Chitinophagales bacterium]
PSESRIIVFDSNGEGEKYNPIDLGHSRETVLQGPWHLDLYPVGGIPEKAVLDQLTDLKQTADHKDFSGTIVYHKELQIPDAAGKIYLSLGHINDVSGLTHNGRSLGTRWYGDHIYDLSGSVQKGINYLEIKIVTTLGAYTKSLKENKAAQEWSGGELFGPTGLTGPVKLLTT